MKSNSLKRWTSAAMTLIFISASSLTYAADITPQFDERKGKWGYVNTAGKWVVKPKYDSAVAFTVSPSGMETSKVTLKGLYGFVDASGKLLAPGAVYESIEALEDGTMLVKVKGKYGVIDSKCVYIVRPELTDYERVEGGQLLVTQKGKKGLLDTTGQYIVNPVYDNVDLTIPEYIIVTKGGKKGILTRDGEMKLQPAQYTDVEPLGRYWKVKNGQKTGLVELGAVQPVVKVDFEDVDMPFSVGGQTYTPIMKKGMWGALDGKGKEWLKCQNQAITPIPELGVCIVTRQGIGERLWYPTENVFLELVLNNPRTVGPFTLLSGSIDEPTQSCPSHLSSALTFNERYDWSRDYTSRKRIYDRSGGQKFSVLYDANGNFITSGVTDLRNVDRFYLVMNNSSCDIYDENGIKLLANVKNDPKSYGKWYQFGNVILSPDNERYSSYKNIKDPLFVRKGMGRWCMLSSAGELSLPGYDVIEPLTEDIIAVKRDGKWGIISEGKETIACGNEEKPDYSESLRGFLFTQDGKKGVRGVDGAVVVPAKYDAITRDGDSDYVVELNGKYGIVGTDGNEILAPEYDTFSPTKVSDHLWVRKGDLYGVVNGDGELIIPIKYADYAIKTIEGRYYEAIRPGGGIVYFDSNGDELKQERRVTVTSQWVDHNIYDKNNNKSLRLNFKADVQFMLDEPVYAEATIYNANGTPAKNKNGKVIKWGYWLSTPRYLFACYNGDNWITFPYAQFVQPKGTKRDYYIKLTFKNEAGQTIPTRCNDKIEFYLTR